MVVLAEKRREGKKCQPEHMGENKILLCVCVINHLKKNEITSHHQSQVNKQTNQLKQTAYIMLAAYLSVR